MLEQQLLSTHRPGGFAWCTTRLTAPALLLLLLLRPLPCCRVIAAALHPVKHKLQESSKFVRHYVAAQKARPFTSSPAATVWGCCSAAPLAQNPCMCYVLTYSRVNPATSRYP